MNRPRLLVLGLSLLAHTAVAAWLVATGPGIAGLIHAGPPWTDPRAATIPTVEANQTFDGQFFYRAAISPFSTDHTLAAVTYDLPSLRIGRFGYSSIAHLLSFGGQQAIVPWALLITNLIAVGVIAWVAGAIAEAFGADARWGLLVSLWPSALYAVALDTSEALTCATLSLTFLGLLRRRYHLASLAMAGAVFTRETATMVALGIGVAALAHWKTPGLRWGLAQVSAVGLACFAAVQVGVHQLAGEFPADSSGDNNLGKPGAGVWHHASAWVSNPNATNAVRMFALLLVVAFAALVILSMRDSQAPLALKVTFVIAGAVMACINEYVWTGPTSFVRTAAELGLCGTVVLLGGPPRWRWAGLGAVGMLWLVAAGSRALGA